MSRSFTPHSEARDLGQPCVETGDVGVDPGRHSPELAWLRADHLDQLGDVAVGEGGELVQGLHAPAIRHTRFQWGTEDNYGISFG